MTMRLLLSLLVAATTLASQPLSAQWSTSSDSWSTAPADSTRQDFQRRLLQALDLTPVQQDSLRLMREYLQLDINALRSHVEVGDILPEEERLRYREALRAYRIARDSLLTSTQLALLERARSHQFEQALYDPNKAEKPKRLADALDLDDLQRRRWLSLLARQREQVRQLRSAGETISTQDYQVLREEYRLSFEAILLPEQRFELERVRLARVLEQQELDALQLELFIDENAPIQDDWESMESLESDEIEDGAEL